ncbi:hypothetical protein PDIG_54430 [Penicillium digitatum PHI26]|uniref:Uncharacterized protein n=2 Tax=Penicillium digitatum TaxID=36651 RepID=K9FN07_PEND2|nr:hypothetical protein PDIP_49650 [Penicillium digitatum Pd1]EKV10955.1 hypothetical protein PDIG_54430 [Penicillium digitatum PHI26]EKV13277.1 hypothetical protein PDIP_49650 [Penicillium digitatum Pd1]
MVKLHLPYGMSLHHQFNTNLHAPSSYLRHLLILHPLSPFHHGLPRSPKVP